MPPQLKEGEIIQVPLAVENSGTKIALNIIRELLAVIFWLYAICKLFIFDLDIYLLNTLDPRLIWIAQYKFFILLGVISLLWLVTKSKYIILWTAYILIYPLILIFWEIPYFIFKQRSWTLAFAFINALISFFKNIKYKFIVGTIFLLALLIVLISADYNLLIVCISALFVILLVAYSRMFIFVFQPSSVFRAYSNLIKKSPTFVLKTLTDKEIRNLPVESLNESQIQIRRTNVQMIVLCNRALLFFSRKLKAYQESRFNIISYVFNLLLLILYTVIVYGAINYGLSKIDPLQFAITVPSNYFIFLYYSFHVFLFGGIAEVSPVMFYAQIFSMSEQLFAITLIFILVALMFSVQNEKYKEELDKTINDTEETGRLLEDMIQTTYSLNNEQAMEEVGKLQGNLMKLILWFSKDVT